MPTSKTIGALLFSSSIKGFGEWLIVRRPAAKSALPERRPAPCAPARRKCRKASARIQLAGRGDRRWQKQLADPHPAAAQLTPDSTSSVFPPAGELRFDSSPDPAPG